MTAFAADLRPLGPARAAAFSSAAASDPGRPWRLALTLLALFLATTAFYNFSLDRASAADPLQGASNTRSDLVNMTGWLVLYAVSGLLVLHGLWRNGLEPRLALLVPFALYVLASSLWSETPTQSLVYCGLLVANIVVADALATRIHPAMLTAVMARLVTVCVAISLVLLALFPNAVMSTPDRPGLLTQGEFFGVYSHKLQMGMNASAAALILLFQPDAIRARLWRWLALAVCLAGILLANSASAIVALAASVALIVTVRRVPRLRTGLYAVVSVVAVAVSVALPHLELGEVTGLVGRSATLTGRGDFWPLASGYILERPWFGFGYGGFFETGPYSRVWDLWSHFEYFFTPNFHNSALDVAIRLGYVGLVAYLAILLTALGVFANRSLGPSADILACMLLLYVASSATDFQLMAHNGLATILMFYAFLVGGGRVYGPGGTEPAHGPR